MSTHVTLQPISTSIRKKWTFLAAAATWQPELRSCSIAMQWGEGGGGGGGGKGVHLSVASSVFCLSRNENLWSHEHRGAAHGVLRIRRQTLGHTQVCNLYVGDARFVDDEDVFEF